MPADQSIKTVVIKDFTLGTEQQETNWEEEKVTGGLVSSGIARNL